MKSKISEPFLIADTAFAMWRTTAEVLMRRPGLLIVCVAFNILIHRWQVSFLPFPARSFGFDLDAIKVNFFWAVVSSITVALYSTPTFLVVQSYLLKWKPAIWFGKGQVRLYINVLLCFFLLELIGGISSIYQIPHANSPLAQASSPAAIGMGLPALMTMGLSIFCFWTLARLILTPSYFLLDSKTPISKSWTATRGYAWKITVLKFLAITPPLLISLIFKSPGLLHSAVHEGGFLFKAVAMAICFQKLSVLNGPESPEELQK
jgi:hypothetical protein